jgi:hypothetical protein
MYPEPMKLKIIPNPMVTIDDKTIDGDLEIEIELESRAGTGDPQFTFRIGGREVEVQLDPDSTLTLSDALAFFARATKRIRERCRQEREAVIAEF